MQKECFLRIVITVYIFYVFQCPAKDQDRNECSVCNGNVPQYLCTREHLVREEHSEHILLFPPGQVILPRTHF